LSPTFFISIFPQHFDLKTTHNGTGLIAIDCLFDRKPRDLPPLSLEAFDSVDARNPSGFYKSFGRKNTMQHILWGACHSDQTSAYAHIGGMWYGAFTYFFCKELGVCQNKLPRADLKAARDTQTPQSECQATTRRTKMAQKRHPFSAAGEKTGVCLPGYLRWFSQKLIDHPTK
jgi:hypothetical protein